MKKPQTNQTREKPRRLAIIADPHVGNFKANGGVMLDGLNQRGHLTMQVLRGAVQTARKQECEALLIAGDLFHSRRPEPAVIAGVQKVFAEEATDIGILILPGNHDMLDATADGGNTACETLQHDATVLNTPSWVRFAWGSVFVVPFQSKEPMSTYLAKVCAMEQQVDPEHSGRRMLLTHVGVFDSDAPPWCADAKDGISSTALFEAMEAAKIPVAFVGNFHNGKRWKSPDNTMEIIQCGTLCPHGHTDAGEFPTVGGVMVIDGWDTEAHEVPGPRFRSETSGEKVFAISDEQGGEQVVEVRPPTSKEELLAISATVPTEATAEEAITEFIDKQFQIPGLKSKALAIWARTGV